MGFSPMEMGCLTALFMGSNGLLHDNGTTQMLVFIELANPIVKGFDWTFLRNLQVHKTALVVGSPFGKRGFNGC